MVSNTVTESFGFFRYSLENRLRYAEIFTLMIRTGIYGGSFNPIHYGHIALARRILEAGDLDEIWFLVSPQNPLKKHSQLLDDDKRLSLARQALADEKGLTASDYEFRLPRPSYTWNTLQQLSADYPERTFSLIIGGDNWACFDRWWHADDIVRHYPIIIYPREDSPIDETSLPNTVKLVHTPLLNVSSTQIRNLIHEGKSIHGLVPDQIEAQVVSAYNGMKAQE